jgi:hypothetical protein
MCKVWICHISLSLKFGGNPTNGYWDTSLSIQFTGWGGWISLINIPLCGPILQAETCQNFSWASIPRYDRVWQNMKFSNWTVDSTDATISPKFICVKLALCCLICFLICSCSIIDKFCLGPWRTLIKIRRTAIVPPENCDREPGELRSWARRTPIVTRRTSLRAPRARPRSVNCDRGKNNYGGHVSGPVAPL